MNAAFRAFTVGADLFVVLKGSPANMQDTSPDFFASGVSQDGGERCKGLHGMLVYMKCLLQTYLKMEEPYTPMRSRMFQESIKH